MNRSIFLGAVLLAACFSPEHVDNPGHDMDPVDAAPDATADSGNPDSGTDGGDGGSSETCDGDDACPITAPACTNNACGACGDTSDCARFAAMPACDEQSGACVECVTNTDCPEAKPFCNAHSCEPCIEDSHCSGWMDGTRVLGVCNGGQCEECSVGKETPCGANSCDPSSLRCTETPRNSRTVCQTCAADSECKAGHLCVATTFQGEAEGGHCLKVDDGSCSQPFLTPMSRASLSAPTSAANLCGFVEERTSCRAILNLQASKACDDGEASSCAAAGSLCEKVGLANNRCTYACEVSDECPSSRPCGSFDMDNIGFCGG